MSKEQLDYWQATKEQHEAGQQLINKLKYLSQQDQLPQYIRAEIADALALARKAAV